MTGTVTFYLVIKALHVMAAFAAYGLPFGYPLVIPYLRRNHPRTLPGVHDIQHRLSIALTGPGTVALFAFGVYMATKDHLWGESWVMVGVTIIAIIAIAGGGIVKWTKELSELARADIDAGGETVVFGAEYDRVYRIYLATETTLGALVLVAIFFMVVKP
ncbi:DUF2269 family protein [Baekduia sp.]|jgi:uncharacterized membrane protein|uniref:DUF2269 family protein n=1 Tax=Baekduia sp. TaxID=2600305 RepID=UPI002DF78A07|nr:DUF2269 family protein [Baekduia sp.]